MSPGPCVTATAPRSSQPAPASLIASATTSLTSSVWRREATSGTTPPNCACSSFWDETIDDSTSRPRDDGRARVVARRLDGEDQAGGVRAVHLRRPGSMAGLRRPLTPSPLPSPST